MNYSFHCKKCGQTVMSNSKEEVKGARALHKARRITLPTGVAYDVPKCRLVPVVPEKQGKPMTLFMHSPFENSALKAASNIIKAGLRAGVDSRMVSFGKFLEETKTWNRDNFVVQSVEKASLLCLYMVGTEYTTEFSQSSLQTLLKTRRVAGQTTMICSHLEPAEFIKRYGFDPGAVPLKFEDEKLLSTIDELLKHMKG